MQACPAMVVLLRPGVRINSTALLLNVYLHLPTTPALPQWLCLTSMVPMGYEITEPLPIACVCPPPPHLPLTNETPPPPNTTQPPPSPPKHHSPPLPAQNTSPKTPVTPPTPAPLTSMVLMGSAMTGPLPAVMSKGMFMPVRGVRMSLNRMTPSGLNACQGCREISTCRASTEMRQWK
jgi:hypothetical protein